MSVGKNTEAATILTNMTIERFHEISLSPNSNKYVSIYIEHDHLDERPLSVNSYHNIHSLQKGEKIYFGINFSDTILLHTGKIAQDLKHNLDLFIGSSLLKPEQKLSVINQFILPKLVCVQNTPASKMSQTFLTKVREENCPTTS